jgi:GNAT superfamily N-acetyltransferase
MPLRLRPFPAELAAQVSTWASTDEEVTMWCARPSAPVTAEQITAWAGEDGVTPYGLFQNDTLVAYGELWVDDADVELARLIVDPAERNHQLGRRLVAELVEVALGRHPHVFMRVHPDNAPALRCYAAVGFDPADPAETAEWNTDVPYVWLRFGPQRITTSRLMAASARAIFDIITDPDGHVRLDGSGMLVAAAGTKRLTAVGDAFVMEMDRSALGDLPMDRYRTRNVVTRIEPDRWLEWSVGNLEGDMLGHVYGYELTAATDGRTAVEIYCDWSRVPASAKARRRWPVVPLDRLERSLANLEQLVTES